MTLKIFMFFAFIVVSAGHSFACDDTNFLDRNELISIAKKDTLNTPLVETVKIIEKEKDFFIKTLYIALYYQNEEHGLKKNYKIINSWLKLGADHGSGTAMALLAKNYLEGNGFCKKNIVKASLYYHACASLWNPLCYKKLGVLYRDNKIPNINNIRDINSAYYFLYLAIDERNYEDFREFYYSLTETQLRDARRETCGRMGLSGGLSDEQCAALLKEQEDYALNLQP